MNQLALVGAMLDRKRLALLLCVLGAALLAGSLAMQGTAHAASPTVTVGSPTNRFAPNVVNVKTGDSVTFSWSAGTHTVDFKGVSPTLNIDSSHTSGTSNVFNTPGTFYYYCNIHATEDQATEAHVQANDAMVGKIVVTAAGSPTTGTNASPRAGASPAAPSTGSGYSSGSNTFEIAGLAGGALLVLAGVTIFAASRRRS